MKGRESGMPPKEMWEGFFTPAETLNMLGLNEARDVAEFGCGYGTFTIPAAQIVKGTVYAIDIESEMIDAAENEAKKRGLQNIKTIRRDFMAEGTGLGEESVDYVMIFNILHIDNPEFMLKEAWQVLTKEGRVGIIHWNYDPKTPRGPSMDIRPSPEQCIQWAQNVGFCNPLQLDLKPYHFGIVMSKKGKVK